jgi:hypothetical protein
MFLHGFGETCKNICEIDYDRGSGEPWAAGDRVRPSAPCKIINRERESIILHNGRYGQARHVK